MHFTKMQGCGNDYILIDAEKEHVAYPAAMAKKLSDRHFGIGADGLILVQRAEHADFKMEMYNADGSEGAMCGNGIRCLGAYVYEKGLTGKKELDIETASGRRRLYLRTSGAKVACVTAEMGMPEFSARKIPVIFEKNCVIGERMTIGGRTYQVSCVSMGNPHAVVLTKDVQQLDLEQIGPCFEWFTGFPDRINAEFVQILDAQTIEMRVWERGSGETLSCGTGACAAVAALRIEGKLKEEEITVHLRGGTLQIGWEQKAGNMWLRGPAITVYDGILA